MTRRERGALIAAVVAVPVAIVLTIVAVDVLRTPGWISTDDARFQTAPLRAAGLWNEPGLLATRARIRTLGIDEDLAYRRTVALFAKLQPGTANQLVDPAQENRWAKLQFELTTGSRENPDAARRSDLQNLLGVLLLARYLYASPDERNNLLTNAIGSFRTAVELDSRKTTRRSTSRWRCERTGRPCSRRMHPTPVGHAARSRARGAREAGTEPWASAFYADRGTFVLLAAVPLAVFWGRRRRADAVRSALRLGRPGRRSWVALAACLAAVPVLVGVAAAQPVITSARTVPQRSDAEVFVVVDTSRSMQQDDE